jgi:hypothetical protein
MSDQEMEEIKNLLKEAYAPLRNTELSRDLWPEMQARLSKPGIRMAWWDWALLAGATAGILLFPAMIPALLYHL